MLAKITSKNQLTLPKSVTQAVGATEYFDVEARAGQIILTPVRIQRGDAVRAKLAELNLTDADMADAVRRAAALARPLQCFDDERARRHLLGFGDGILQVEDHIVSTAAEDLQDLARMVAGGEEEGAVRGHGISVGRLAMMPKR